jgi:hypothetical protein
MHVIATKTRKDIPIRYEIILEEANNVHKGTRVSSKALQELIVKHNMKVWGYRIIAPDIKEAYKFNEELKTIAI